MLVRVRSGSVAPNYLRVLYEPGQVFNFELGDGIPLPNFLELASAPEPSAPIAPEATVHRRRKRNNLEAGQ